jgi:hypothetical protein
MVIRQSESLLHWNYFVALEQDIVNLSRFVEFEERNFRTYSIEMVRLLLIACSETDSLARQLCDYFEPAAEANRMDEYRAILRPLLTRLENGVVEIPRYGLTLKPWVNWSENHSPDWWTEHQGVKHRRNEDFGHANLANTLNAAAGLLLLAICFYHNLTRNRVLAPPPQLFRPGIDFGATCATAGIGVVFQLAGGVNVR